MRRTKDEETDTSGRGGAGRLAGQRTTRRTLWAGHNEVDTSGRAGGHRRVGLQRRMWTLRAKDEETDA